VLEILAEYFCLRTNEVAAIERNHTPTENDKRAVRRTLGLLYQQGFAYRLPYLDLDQEGGARTYAYGLSAKGHDWALANGCSSHSSKTLDEHSQRTLDHELEISSFHRAMKTFCRSHSLYLYWRQKDLKKTVAPDALFAVTDPRQPEGRDTLYYFLEVERSKIGNFKNGEPSILRKLGRYYEYYNSDACEREWQDFRQFRVIVVQPSDERRQNLLKELEERFPHRMFWLTTNRLYEQDVGAAIFLTPRDRDAQAHSFQTAFSAVVSVLR
jgi:Replication-relaxation